MGVSPIFVRYASADVGPFASAFWRVAFALPVLYAWMRIEEASAPSGPQRDRFGRGTILAGLAFAGDLCFWHLAILNTTVAAHHRAITPAKPAAGSATAATLPPVPPVRGLTGRPRPCRRGG